MRYNGVDIRAAHRALSVSKEIFPGMQRREMITVRGNNEERYAGHMSEASEAVVRVNIAGRTNEEAYEARQALAAWAAGNGQAAPLEPTHWPGKAYDAVVAEIGDMEPVFGHAEVEVTFLLPDGRAYSIIPGAGSGDGRATLRIGGSDSTLPVISQTIKRRTSGLTWSIDGRQILKLKSGYSVPAGAEVVADFATGSLTENGAHIEAQIDYTGTTWQPGFTPGVHEIVSSDGGNIKARWRDRWI